MRVLLVEDEPDLGQAIQRMLTQAAYIVDWAKDGLEGWSYLEDLEIQYTLGIFDWLLPHMSGVELCQRLRSRQNAMPILMLTAKDRPEDIAAGLDAGADDYLVKPFLKVELFARLRALQRRSPHFQPQKFNQSDLVLDYGTQSIFSTDPRAKQDPVLLTHKEFQLMEYLMKHPNQIVTRDQILIQIWSHDAEPMSNVVAALMRQLRRKLSASGLDHKIETVYGMGYRLNLP